MPIVLFFSSRQFSAHPMRNFRSNQSTSGQFDYIVNVWCLVKPLVYFQTLCVWTAKALARLSGCAGSPEPSLVAYVISTIISWPGSNILFRSVTNLEEAISSHQTLLTVTVMLSSHFPLALWLGCLVSSSGMIWIHNWAWENLSSGLTHQHAHIPKLLASWNFVYSNYRYYTIQAANNKGADQTAWMHRLICIFCCLHVA